MFFSLFLLSVLFVFPTDLTHRVSTVFASYGDFGLSASPSAIIISQGGTSSSTISVSGQVDYSGNVTFSIADTFDSLNIRVGTTPSFVVISAAHGSATSMLQVSASSWVRPGSYTISLLAFDGTIQHSTTIVLTVTGQDFAITSSPTRLTFPVRQNTTQTANIMVSSLGGFSGDVNLTMLVGSYDLRVAQEPSASPSSRKVSITPSGPISFPLAISVNSSMIATAYTARIDGVAHTSTGNPHRLEFDITIGPDFNLTDTMKSMIVHQGAMSVATVTVNSLNGFADEVAMYVGPISGDPNPDFVFYPPSSTPSPGGTGITHLTVRADSHTGLGTYSVWIEASDVTGGLLAESLPFNVTVVGPVTGPDFTIYADPANQQTTIGSVVTSTINLFGENGFTGPLTLFADYGFGASLNPLSLSLPSRANVTSTLTVNIPAPGPGGNSACAVWWYNCGGQAIIVVASDSTGFSHWTWANITATPFSVVASPARHLLKAGSAATFNVTVEGIGKFNDTVTLSTRTSGGVLATLSNSRLNFSAAQSSLSSNLTVSVPAGTPDGDYAVQITGTYLRPAYICSCAPKYPLNYTVPIDVVVTSQASSASTIFGLQPIEFYSIVAAIVAGAIILVSYLLVWRRKPTQIAQG
jgi:hypothetical protein